MSGDYEVRVEIVRDSDRCTVTGTVEAKGDPGQRSASFGDLACELDGLDVDDLRMVLFAVVARLEETRGGGYELPF